MKKAMTTREYMLLADRTNKTGDQITLTREAASALLTALPTMIQASYAADRLKASIVYGAKLRELQGVQVEEPDASVMEKEILHAALGIFSEGGEILEQLHHSYTRDEKLDRTHMAEELGDVLWFVSLMATNIGYTFDELMTMNIQKLASRYPDAYSDELAMNRNVEGEKDALQNSAN